MTASGHKFWPTDPRPEDIFIEDIAHALSKICRYTGHVRVKGILSVAQHAVLVARFLPGEFKLWGLLHDAAEAYLADIAKPIKSFLQEAEAVEEKLHECVAQRFGLQWPMPHEVKAIDRRMLTTEAHAFMHPDFFHEKENLGTPIEGLHLRKKDIWKPKKAKKLFQFTYEVLGGSYAQPA